MLCAKGIQSSGPNSYFIVENNTFYGVGWQAFGDQGAGIIETETACNPPVANTVRRIIRNNIFSPMDIGMSIGNGTASYNLCDGGGAFGSNALTSSPLYVNAAAFNFRIPSNSPAAGSGTATTLGYGDTATADYDGVAPIAGTRSRGAFEPSGPVAPILSSASINPAGDKLSLVFNQPMQAGAGGNAGWTLSVSPGATLGTMTGVGSNTLVYNLSRTINAGESLTLLYTQPGNGIESVSGTIDLASITTPAAVANNSTQGSTSTPVITLPAGPYFGTQTTTITDSDTAGGAVIRYTTDGSTPTAASALYSAPISIAVNQSLKAIAIWSGHSNSAVATSAYEVISWVSTGTTWKTFAVPQKTGTFTWNFSVLAPAAGSDCVVGIGPAPISAYTGLACIVQFLGHTINSINGGGYTAGPAYTAGALYNFVAIINTTAHTWTLTVTPAAGGASTTIVTNGAFRTEQATASPTPRSGLCRDGRHHHERNVFPAGASSARYIGCAGAGERRRHPMSLPINDKQAVVAIKYSDGNWGVPIKDRVTEPFTEHHIYGILCQETAYFWLNYIQRITPDKVSARCVLDGSGDVAGTSRNAFPRNTEAFRRHFGDDFTELLIREGNKSRLLRGMKPWGKLYKGYGPFQYDLQYSLTDEVFFKERRWYDVSKCVDKCLGELEVKYKHQGNVPQAIRAYNGSGPRAEQYAKNVLYYAALSQRVLGAKVTIEETIPM
jgi:hypothetical protein